MSHRSQQNEVARVRRIVARELSNAIEMHVERGTVVTGVNGKCIAFTVKYDAQQQQRPRVSVKHPEYGTIDSYRQADAVSIMLSAMGFTR